jgi:hypothetical protein
MFSCYFFRAICSLFLQDAAIKENVSSRAVDGEWKLTVEKLMKVVRKVLPTRSEEEFEELREVPGVPAQRPCMLFMYCF